MLTSKQGLSQIWLQQIYIGRPKPLKDWIVLKEELPTEHALDESMLVY